MGDWGFIPNPQLGILSPIGYLISPIGDNISNCGYFLLVVYYPWMQLEARSCSSQLVCLWNSWILAAIRESRGNATKFKRKNRWLQAPFTCFIGAMEKECRMKGAHSAARLRDSLTGYWYTGASPTRLLQIARWRPDWPPWHPVLLECESLIFS